jgi:hypothetical protein
MPDLILRTVVEVTQAPVFGKIRSPEKGGRKRGGGELNKGVKGQRR